MEMTGRLWLTSFTHIAESKRQKYPEEPWNDFKLTAFMQDVMDEVGEKMNCYVVRKRPGDKEQSREYLNLDAIFFDRTEYDLAKDKSWNPFVIPRVVVELENDYKIHKISYCLWKILCVRAPTRVLICYQKDKNRVATLRQHLEKLIWQGSLMKGDEGDLLVIIGDDSFAVSKTLSTTYFGDYYYVFEWRDDKLANAEGVDWSLYIPRI